MKSVKKYITFFLLGGVGYALIELAWRRRTHLSMVLAGGICFILFSVISRRLKACPLVIRATVCALAVTLVELIFGLVFNVMLNMNVWDYSNEVLNFKGQICPLYTLMWGGLSLVFLPIASLLNQWFDGDSSYTDGVLI